MQKYLPALFFLTLSCFCIGIRQAGYLFLLDDSLYLQDFGWVYDKFFQLNAGVFYRCYHILTSIIPAWIAQRGVYISVLFSAGILGYRWTSKIFPSMLYAPRCAGIFTMINPRIYGRILDGQRYVAMSVIFVGWMLYYIYDSKKRKPYIYAGLCGGAAMMMSAHAVFFILVSLGLYLCRNIYDSKQKSWDFTLVYKLCVAGVLGLLCNIHWITTQFLGGESAISLVSVINSDHFQGFATNAGNTNVYLSTLGGFGYRGERQHRFMTIQATGEQIWLILFCMIFTCVCMGTVYIYKTRQYRLLGFLTSLGLTSYILGIGISGETVFAPITQWMYDHLPMYVGLREPQKWIGILMIVYAILGGLGVEYIVKQWFGSDDWTDRMMIGFLLCLPVIYTPFMLGAGRGQLVPRDYPQSRYDLKKEIDMPSSCVGKQDPCYDVLVFPRHMYQSFSFTRGSIAHPLANFFQQQKVLLGDNMEMPAIYTQSSRPESKVIEKYIGPGGLRYQSGSDIYDQVFFSDLKNLGIHEILLLKEVDWKNYQPALERLEKNAILKREKETDTYILFKLF